MTPVQPPRRVLLVEDEGILRGLLKDALEQAGYQVLAYGNAPQAFNAFMSFDPDALISDIDLGSGGNGLDLAAALVGREPTLAVVILSMYGIPSDVSHPALAQARYVNKMNLDNPATLLTVLESTLRGEPTPAIDPKAIAMPAASARLAQLTKTQIQVLRMIAAGLTNQEIAERRGISIVSVEHIIRRMQAALDLPPDSTVNRRVAVTRLYYEGAGTPTVPNMKTVRRRPRVAHPRTETDPSAPPAE